MYEDCTRSHKAEMYLIREQARNTKYNAYIMSCKFPENLHQIPKTVSVSDKLNSTQCVAFTFKVHSTDDIKDMKEYAVCLPPIWGNVLTLTNFIEFIELNRLLGASTFYIYNEDIKPDVLKAVEMYEKQGVVKLILWNLPHFVNYSNNEMTYHGQIVHIHECLYRTRGKAKWVGFHDFDEFLVPLHQPTIPSFINVNIKKHDAIGFCLQSTYFPKKLISTQKKLQNETLITQKYLFRQNTIFPKRYRSKCIVDPRKVFETRIHYLFRIFDFSIQQNLT